ncbi:hypothetical protein [uncultured Alteromonas sp.]|uniref:hypothetical protein n=1 Tax=uncultured Alteromonas sp. TaxID=179113 RepID=UPI0030EC2EC8
MTRILKLLQQFPLVTLLTVLLFTSMMSLLIVTTENSELKQKLSDAKTAIPAAKECSDTVALIAKDCKVEVESALAKVKPIIKYIDKPAKSAGEFNLWVEGELK